jgi:hypothetical protein
MTNSLSSLYRRLTAGNATPAADAADLAAVADGSLASDRRESTARVLAASSVHANVVHVLRDLKADSEALAADVSRTQRETTHRRQQRGDRRIAASGRRFGGAMRWATAMAACLVAVVGVWSLRHGQTGAPSTARAHATVVARGDVIFSERDRISAFGMDAPKAHKVRVEGDRLFHSDFNG